MSHPLAGFGANPRRGWAIPARGWINENAADGILVVQVRHLRAISRKISQLASLEALMTPWVSEHSTIKQPRLAE
jgi:hypothetical protein